MNSHIPDQDAKRLRINSPKPLPDILDSNGYGRWQDVQRLFGIKRGILYRLIAERKIKSISLREPGKRFGCRLIYLPSVKAYLDGLLAAQCPENTPISPSPSIGGLGERE